MSIVRQQGVALITALLIMSLLAILAATLSWENALDVRRTMTMIYLDEGTQAAYGAESWVSNMLRDDFRDSSTDHLGEIWAAEFPILPIESESVQGLLTGELTDLQGRFNVNNLLDNNGDINQRALEQFQRLLRTLDLDPRIAGVTADWIDADQDTAFPDGAEDSIYTSKLPPYRTANQPLSNVSELMAVDGMDKASYDTLAPFIAALPGHTGINVNTAPAEVLVSLDEKMSAADAESLVSERENGGFTDMKNRFATLVAPEVLDTLEETSSFFQLKVVVQIATVRVTYYSLLFRDVGGSGEVVPILRSFGTI
ncbi:MAG TPA: type II secretion system minor pseudopilin GspK [Woeseiaceae bacterium]|nr:type II secretion system minor pseudopilin GspK [Woeseiaceae bacterium]